MRVTVREREKQRAKRAAERAHAKAMHIGNASAPDGRSSKKRQTSSEWAAGANSTRAFAVPAWSQSLARSSATCTCSTCVLVQYTKDSSVCTGSLSRTRVYILFVLADQYVSTSTFVLGGSFSCTSNASAGVCSVGAQSLSSSMTSTREPDVQSGAGPRSHTVSYRTHTSACTVLIVFTQTSMID